MPRKTGLLLPASLLAAFALLAVAFLAHVPPGSHALVRSAFGGGPSRVLGPGWHLRIPLYQVLHRYPSGVIHLEGVEEVSSSEGVGLQAPYSFSARIEASHLAIFDEHARGREAEGFLREVVKRTLSAWAAEESAARWGVGESRSAPAAVTGEIGALGLTDVALSIGKTAAPPQAERAAALETLRARARATGRKILLLGLDGADWQLIDPWIREGKLPTLKRLKEQGAWANLKSMQPILSPLLWTTVATGRRPEDHGVVDFLVRDPGTGQRVPISSRFRKVAALWNILSEMGRKVDVVAWWASWPAEPVDGVVISDRVSYSLFGYQADPTSLPGATYPAGYLAGLRGRLVTDRDIGLEEVRRFAQIDAAEFKERRAQIDQTDPRKAYTDPVNHLTRVLAATRNYEAIALDLLSRGQPELMMIYFQGIDEVGHRFQHMMPPRMAMASPQDYARFNGTVEAFYRYQDRIVGEILARADPRTLVVVLSDHGFKNGPARPTDDPPYIEGKPGKWHRLYGIFLLSGPGVKRGQIDTVSLLDIAPTVLALAGIPPSREMPGRVLSEAFEARAAAGLPTERVATYEVIPREPGTSAADASAADREMIENLRSLGYIAGAGDTADAGGGAERAPGTELSGDTVTYHANLAALQLKAKHYDLAEAEVKAALRLIPDYIPALMTQAAIFQVTRRPQDALEVYRRVAESGQAESGVFTALANLYVKTGGVDQGITEFSKFRQERPAVAEIVSALGILAEARTDLPGAEVLYRQALDIDPLAAEAAARLYEILKKRHQETTLEPVVSRALSTNANSVAHQNLMGLIREAKGDLTASEEHFRRAVALDPDYAGVLANLGSLLARTGRSAEAISTLSRAVEKEPGNYEARINLGAALGKAGRHAEAIQVFEEARQRGFRSPTLFNGLAVAYHETGQYQKCIESLKESLAADPNQPQVREMLAEVEARRS